MRKEAKNLTIKTIEQTIEELKERISDLQDELYALYKARDIISDSDGKGDE